jgi:hypothetical protein
MEVRHFVRYSFIHSSMAPQPFVGPWPLPQFFNIFNTDGRTRWTSDQPVSRPLPKHRPTQTQNKHTQTSMPWVGFKPTIPVFERAKTVHALDQCSQPLSDRAPINYFFYKTRARYNWRQGPAAEKHWLGPRDQCDRPPYVMKVKVKLSPCLTK